MQAMVCTKFGPAGGLQIREVETPTPRDNEISVRIRATTVTAGDVVLRSLKLPVRIVFGLAFGLRKNAILGHELAGEVESAGKDVDRFRIGDPVFASTGNRGGAYAEYICLPQEGMVARKPANMTFEEAAAVPIGANTALHILRKGKVQSGQRVLVYGASGSVGTYAVQLARSSGADVTGVCSTANLELVASLGAGEVIDYTKEDFRGAGTFDVVFDAAGKISASQAQSSLNPGGAYLTVRSSTKEKQENLVFLKQLIEAGQLSAVIDRRYPFAQIPDAHRYVEKGHKKGNVVITVP